MVIEKLFVSLQSRKKKSIHSFKGNGKMKKKRDVHLVAYLLILVAILIGKMIHSEYGIDYLTFTIIYIYFGLWWFICNRRYYVLTVEKMDGWNKEDYLTYQYQFTYGVIENHRQMKINHVYVKRYNDNEYYELDYALTLGKDINISEYNKFIRENGTVGALCMNMSSKLSRVQFMRDYDNDIQRYNDIRLATFVLGLFGMFLYYCLIHGEMVW